MAVVRELEPGVFPIDRMVSVPARADDELNNTACRAQSLQAVVVAAEHGSRMPW